MNFPCTKVFASGKNTCTAQKRRPAVRGPKSYQHLYCFDDTKKKGTP